MASPAGGDERTPGRLVRDEIRAASAYHTPPADGMVKLDAMENPHPLPPEIARELGERLAAVAINRYPDPTASSLKAAIREAMAIPDVLDVMLGNGSDEILQIVSLALARPGATVLAPEPSFAVYRMAAVAAGMEYAGVALRPDFTLDEDAMLAAMARRRPALTWIAYPNNPTGNLFDRGTVQRVIEQAPGLVAIDEAYYAFSGGASLLDEVARQPNVLLVRTVSKLGLAGLRLGVAIGTRPWIQELEKLRMPYNVNVLSACAAEWLLGRREVLDAQVRDILRERGALEAALDRIPAVRRFPSAANFVLVRVPDAPAAFEALKQRGILVRNFHGSHPLLAHCLRLTVGTSVENHKLVAALAAALAPHHA